MRKKWIIFSGVSGCIFVFDQLFKFMTRFSSSFNREFSVSVFKIELTYSENTGISYGLFQDLSWGVVNFWGIIGLLCLVFIIFVFYKLKSSSVLLVILAWSLAFGGALSNVFDRLYLGFVVDYIKLYFADRLMFPTFNLGDTALVIGLTVFVFLEVNKSDWFPKNKIIK